MVHSVGLAMEKEKENHEMMEKNENPQMEEFACLGVKFQKACEVRVIWSEACELTVKFPFEIPPHFLPSPTRPRLSHF
jgi:hypothetical protein